MKRSGVMKGRVKNDSILEVIFIITWLLCIFISNIDYILSIIIIIGTYILSFLFLVVFRTKIINSNLDTEKQKKFLYGFILVFIVYMAIQLYYKFGLNLINMMDQYTHNQLRLFQLPLIMTILLSYFFNIRLRRDFNWGIKLKDFLVIILLYVLLEIVPLIMSNQVEILMNISLIDYFKNLVQQIYYPSIVEEVVFRGLLISGLIGYGVSHKKSNIIQSIIFGLIHILNYNEFSINIILTSCF
ncbi:MAG: CPBP family intramembrane metalloprotease [Firmicutes bacterium]|nr:CPBP family intramembrane metalloprotease [Bacillota bacterium]